MIKLFWSIFPGFLKRRITAFTQVKMREGWENISSKIPKYELETKHIKNARIIVNREAMLELFPKNGIVAELGVDKGDFSEIILKTCSPSKLHLVDVWESERYNETKKLNVASKFEKEVNAKTVEINLGYSTEVVKQFPDDYFDWVYIDTTHSYKTTIEELNLYSRKIKPGGLIAGHDYIVGNWNGMVRYGVIEAVYEFCSKNDWEIVYLTAENKGYPSFAIKKID
jgi:hypothetical protein